MNNKLITIGVIALVIGVGIGYGGAKVLASPRASARGAFTRGGTASTTFAGGGRFGGAGGMGLLTGTVAKEDSGSITIDTRDGSSHLVLFTPGTTVSKSVAGTMSDVSVGATIIVTGTTNSDGSVSANNIQLRPSGSSQNAPFIPAAQGTQP